MQIKDHDQLHPAVSGPDIADIACPLMVWTAFHEVSVRQVWRDIELLISIGFDLVIARSDDRYAVLPHPLPGSRCLQRRAGTDRLGGDQHPGRSLSTLKSSVACHNCPD